MPKLDQEKVEVYSILLNMKIKLALVIVAIIVFLVMFGCFLLFVWKEKYMQAGIVGGTDTIFAIIILKVYNHYFK